MKYINFEVFGIDNINEYYDVRLKYARINETGIKKELIEWGTPVKSTVYKNYTFCRMNLEDSEAIENLFKQNKFNR